MSPARSAAAIALVGLWPAGCGAGAPAPDEVVMPAFTLDPGDEIARCVDVRLGNDAPLHLAAVESRVSPTVHHAVVYASSAAEERRDPFPCTPFEDASLGRATPLLITQVAEETVALPAGVAFRLEPRQMVRIEVHALNQTRTHAEVGAGVRFVAADPRDGHALADVLFYGQIDIDLAPGERATVGPAWLPAPAGARVFALTGHTHARGTGVRVRRTAGPEDEGDEIYSPRPWDWDTPPVARFEPPIVIGEGEGFRFSCDYWNREDRRVVSGASARDEMCSFWAYYHPSMGHVSCVAGLGLDGCCPGDSPLCGGP